MHNERMSKVEPMTADDLPALAKLPGDNNLYERAPGNVSFGGPVMDYELVKCKMCGAAVAKDSLEQHKAFHVDLMKVIDRLNEVSDGG